MLTQPRTSSHAVYRVVEREKVGRGGACVPVARLTLQLAACDWLAQVHAGGTGDLQHFRISVLEFTNEQTEAALGGAKH